MLPLLHFGVLTKRHVDLSSPTRDQTRTPALESEVLTTGSSVVNCRLALQVSFKIEILFNSFSAKFAAPLNSNTKNYKIGDVTQDSCSVYSAEPRRLEGSVSGSLQPRVRLTDFLKRASILRLIFVMSASCSF